MQHLAEIVNKIWVKEKLSYKLQKAADIVVRTCLSPEYLQLSSLASWTNVLTPWTLAQLKGEASPGIL